MRIATSGRRLETSEDVETERRWRLGFFVGLSCVSLIALVIFAQQRPAKISILPTGPLPGINIP